MKRLLDLPPHLINGLAVALGIGLIQLVVAALAGEQAAALALGGAVCASLADVPNTLARTGNRVASAALLACAAALLALLLKATPWALGLAVGLVSFGAMMTMAWGARAGAVAFAPILALVFTMAVPLGSAALQVLLLWNCVGALAYVGWALLAARVLQRRYRALVLAQALAAAARLLQARARLLTAPLSKVSAASKAGAVDDEPGASHDMQAWIQGEAELAERLQAARDFIFTQPESAAAQRETLIVLLLVELRDVLLASRMDLELLGRDSAGQWVLLRVAGALQTIAGSLLVAATAAQRQQAAQDVSAQRQQAAPHGSAQREQAAPDVNAQREPAAPDTLAANAAEIDFDTLFAHAPLAAEDPRSRLLPSLADRLRRLHAEVQRVHTLQRGEPATSPLSRSELQHFVSPEGWPLAALRAQWHWRSPVLRHALRAGLALGTAFYIALLLPWASHPHWLVLSVAVVLRGNLEQTLARRNARVLGTLLGCVLVLGLSLVHGAALLSLVFLLAVGTAHAFVLRRYWLTATAATVMALLQQHLVHPAGGFAIPERAADTLLGAALAWGFSYVLPWWERRSLPNAITRALQELGAYAQHALQPQAAQQVAQRLARRRAYDALAALASALQRSRVEPRAVRLPLQPVAALIDHGQRLMAHLSMVRVTLSVRRSQLGAPADEALAQTAAVLARCLTLGTALSTSLSTPLSTPPTPTPHASAAEAETAPALPLQPPAEDILPWLRRRLALLEHDAQHIHDAAARALAAMRPEA